MCDEPANFGLEPFVLNFHCISFNFGSARSKIKEKQECLNRLIAPFDDFNANEIDNNCENVWDTNDKLP